MRICIDAGHNYNGVDTGAVGKLSREQDNTFEIASRLASILTNAGHSVRMTRMSLQSNLGDNVNDSLNARAQISNGFSADLFVSIHCNSGGGVGVETYIIGRGGKAEQYAERVQAELVALGRTNRKVKEGNFAVLRKTAAPAILVEVGFIDNANEERWILNNLDEIAFAIAHGIDGTITRPEPCTEDDVAELQKRGILSDAGLWRKKAATDQDVYWLMKKMAAYVKDRGV